MNHTVTLPDQTTFAANDGETVLAAAARQNLNLPHSCKSGVCGQCKAELVSGDIQMGGHSEQALSEAEKAQGKILMCCTTAQSDISINIPGYKADALPVRTLPARIESIIFKHDVALLKLALPKAPPFAFYAGYCCQATSAAATPSPIRPTKKAFWNCTSAGAKTVSVRK